MLFSPHWELSDGRKPLSDRGCLQSERWRTPVHQTMSAHYTPTQNVVFAPISVPKMVWCSGRILWKWWCAFRNPVTSLDPGIGTPLCFEPCPLPAYTSYIREGSMTSHDGCKICSLSHADICWVLIRGDMDFLDWRVYSGIRNIFGVAKRQVDQA